MSLLIRQQIAIVAARLKAEIDEANAALAPVDAAKDINVLAAVSAKSVSFFNFPLTAAKDINVLAAVSGKLKNDTDLAQKQFDKWTNLMGSLSGADLTAEEKRCQDFKVGGEEPLMILEAAGTVLVQVDLALDRLRPAAAVHLPVPPAAPPAAGAAVVAKIHLPPLNWPEFDGKEESWQRFWASFEPSVHNNTTLSGSQKFEFLVSKFSSTALPLLDGYERNDANYATVVDMLKKDLATKCAVQQIYNPSFFNCRRRITRQPHYADCTTMWKGFAGNLQRYTLILMPIRFSPFRLKVNYRMKPKHTCSRKRWIRAILGPQMSGARRWESWLF